MMITGKKAYRWWIALVTIGVVCLLSFALANIVGCSPATNESDQGIPDSVEQEDAETGLADQQIDWTMQSDCATCHTSEAGSMADTDCPQAVAHADMVCVECHSIESVLATAHEGITYGDKPATRATVETVDPQSCIECHGDFAEMSERTAGSTALTDSNGTAVNPHELLSGEKHEANRPTCTSCHNIHSENLSKDSMKFCAQCHHRGVFTCGNCHAVE